MNNAVLHPPDPVELHEVTDDWVATIDPAGRIEYWSLETGYRLPPLNEIDLKAHWSAYLEQNPRRAASSRFLDWLSKRTCEAEYVGDEVTFCVACSTPQWRDECIVDGHDELACSDCIDQRYTACPYCDRQFRPGALVDTLAGGAVCYGCRENNFQWCDHCEGYYDPECDEDGYHQHGRCPGGDRWCEAPRRRFSIRNVGHPPLANDTRVTVGLPAGIISEEGMEEIRAAIHRWSWILEGHTADGSPRGHRAREAAARVQDLGHEWQTKEGNFTRRLSRMVYRDHRLKVPPDLLSQIGNLGNAHSQGAELEIEVTRELNGPAADFYHEDSCWWGSYSGSRCALKSNGGFGLRSFDEYGVTGRAWVMPMKKDPYRGLQPTFETMCPDAFVVFNGYGALSGYTPARIMAHLAGMSYRRIGFTVDSMYINCDTGYLVAPQAICDSCSSLPLAMDQHSNLADVEERAARDSEEMMESA